MIIGTCNLKLDTNSLSTADSTDIKLILKKQQGEELRNYINRLAESQREELYNQPKLLGLNGPMYNGEKILKSTGEEVVVIRYEK